jgi:hypothetical protein
MNSEDKAVFFGKGGGDGVLEMNSKNLASGLSNS